MTAARPTKAATRPQGRTRIGNGASYFFDGVDERSTVARRFREIFAELLAEIGGHPSERQRHLARRAAALAILAEFDEARLVTGADINAADYATIANALRRVLADLHGQKDSTSNYFTPGLAKFLAARKAVRRKADADPDADAEEHDVTKHKDAEAPPSLQDPDLGVILLRHDQSQ